MSPSFQQILLVLLVIVLIFGAGRIPRVMGDMAKGIKAFRKGMTEEDKEEPVTVSERAAVEHKPAAAAPKPAAKKASSRKKTSGKSKKTKA